MRQIHLYSRDNKPINAIKVSGHVYNTLGNPYCNHALTYIMLRLTNLVNCKYYIKENYTPKYKLTTINIKEQGVHSTEVGVTINVMINSEYAKTISQGSLTLERELVKQFNVSLLFDSEYNRILAYVVVDVDGNKERELFEPNTLKEYQQIPRALEKMLFEVMPTHR